MEQAYVTTLGLYQYDPTLFDGMVIPPALDRQLLINSILYQTANMEVYYPDPYFFKQALANWSSIKAPIWKKLWDTTQYDYNPIHNYDRTEEHERAEDMWGTANEKGTLSSTSSDDMTHRSTEDRDIKEDINDDTNENYKKDGTHTSDSTGKTTDSTTGSVEETVSAFNSSSYEPSKKTDSTQSYTSDVTGHVTNTDDESGNTATLKTIDRTMSDDLTKSGSENRDIQRDDTTTNDRSQHEARSGTEKVRAYGNIGVTTTQQMIEAEREVVQFDIYAHIVEDYKQAFCLLVY